MTDFPDLLAVVDDGNKSNAITEEGPPREVNVMKDDRSDELGEAEGILDDLLGESNEEPHDDGIDRLGGTARSQKVAYREDQIKRIPALPSVTKPSRSRSTSQGHEIIHVEDLSERLNKDDKGFGKNRSRSPRTSSDDDTSKTESDYSFQNEGGDGSNSVGSSSTASDDDDSDDNSEGTQDLLERAHDRIALQGMQEEIQALKEVIVKKTNEVDHLSGQLRRAIDTKCDLVLAHTELERHHEFNLQRKAEESNMLMKANFGLIENQSELEKDLMNEIVVLTSQLKETKQQQREELDDWERMHKNAMLEKDLQIAQLKEEIRKIKDSQQTTARAAHGHSNSTGNGILKGLVFQ